MNAPYDGDRGQGPGGSASAGGPPPGHEGAPGQVPPPHPAPDAYPQDAYLQDAYDQDPYRAQDLTAQDPVTEALYDRAAHPPPPPGTYEAPQPLYNSPPAARTPRTPACGPRRLRPSRRARRGSFPTATTPGPHSSWASTTDDAGRARNSTSQTPSRISSVTSRATAAAVRQPKLPAFRCPPPDRLSLPSRTARPHLSLPRPRRAARRAS